MTSSSFSAIAELSVRDKKRILSSASEAFEISSRRKIWAPTYQHSSWTVSIKEQKYCHCNKKLARLQHQSKQIICCANAECESISQIGVTSWLCFPRDAGGHSASAPKRGAECGNRISGAKYLTVLHSNYGSVLLSFEIFNTGRTTDKLTSSTNAHLVPLRQASCTVLYKLHHCKK